jgi:uncharacterized protein YdeI (BOF family)
MTTATSAKSATIAALLALAFTGSVHAQEMAISSAGVASEALITLSTTGNPDPLMAKLGGNVISSEALQKKVARLLKLDKQEHLAPKALVTPNGETYAMVAPTITKDNYIFVDRTGNVMRMDVGFTEGHKEPFLVQKLTELPNLLTGEAPAALITLATTGNPEPLHALLGGTIISSEALQSRAGKQLNLAKNEHLAPKALVTPTGETYAMVAPTITKDNFMFLDNKGNVMRMDVGDTEGHHMPFVVLAIVEDGGTAWYVEFWNWLTGK